MSFNKTKRYVASIFVWVPKANCFLSIREGTGDNLLDEDIREGYVDYVYIETYLSKEHELVEYDGGQLMLRQPFEDVYAGDVEGERLVNDAMELLWAEKNLPYVVIEVERKEVETDD